MFSRKAKCKPKKKTERELIEELLRTARETSKRLHELVCFLKSQSRPGRLNLTMPQTTTNSPTASITARIRPTNKAGQPDAATNIVWSTNSPDLLTLTPSANGLSCLIKAVGPASDPANPPSVHVDASDSNGVPFLGEMDTVAITDVTGPLPGALNLTFDAPVP